METSPEHGAEAGEPAAAGPAHYSTGRLTTAQAAAVDAWRDRLLERQHRASTSDAIAAALDDLLARQPPEPLALAAYAYNAIRAQRDHARGAPRPGAPVHSPVSYYLPPDLAHAAEDLRHQARAAALAELRRIKARARALHPGTTPHAALNRAAHTLTQAQEQGLHYTRTIPRGALARLAIDHWAPLPPDTVIRAAVTWAQTHHTQQHKPRKDMTQINKQQR